MKEQWKKYIAEFIGTAILVFVACGVAARLGGQYGGVPTALTFGLVLIALVYTIGEVSGCHVNPAVSFGLYINGKMSTKDFGFYILAQFLGAIFGGALLYAIMYGSSMGVNLYAPAGTDMLDLQAIWVGMLVEVLMTFIFVLVIISVTRKGENKLAGVIIGLTLMVVHLFALPFTGTSVNPARSFGVALFGGPEALSQVWMFLVAPMIGAALAATFAQFIFNKDEVVAEPEPAADAAPAAKEPAAAKKKK